MLHGFGGWVRRLFALPAVADLRRRVEELERAELDRERITAEQIEQLKKLFKRQRTREAREVPEEQGISRKDALRREYFGGRGTNGVR